MKLVHALAGVSLVALATPVLAQAPAPMVKAAPVADLVKQVDIPYQAFTLKNGLRVIVHTDRKAPVVAVSVWYDVGSTFEPKGKTGFAHLFEHLMFNGSENAPGEFFAPLKAVGATDYNGTTSFDRTNYFDTVPVGALDLALFLESDRMGHLTGAITPAVLDEQRGVVQNEKRGNDNQPYGLVQYKLFEGLFPADHPYAHTPIGSMADLDGASLADVKGWFKDHYGPNNAVLVLAGDIDAKAAQTLVEKYFGAIPRGPDSVKRVAAVTTLAAPRSDVLQDQVAATLLTRTWTVPGLNDKDAAPLTVAAGVLGGLASSRLDNLLVKRDQVAVQASASNQSLAQIGLFQVTVVVKPGVDPAKAGAALDAVIADFLKTGPTADEVHRVLTTNVSRRIAGLESVGGFGGKAVALAEGALYSNDPGFYKKRLADLARQTPASVKAAADKWLGRPVYALSVVPGSRGAYAEAVVPPAVKVVAAPEQAVKGTRGPAPSAGGIAPLDFPTVQRTRLSNGIELVYAQRTTVPVTQAILSFDAGTAADPVGKAGLQTMTAGMLEEGIPGYDSTTLAEAEERLGADIGAVGSTDRTQVTLRVPSANLAPALDLWSAMARMPAFPEAEFARVKNQALAGVAQEFTNPAALAGRALPPLIYGPASPYARSLGTGNPVAIQGLTRADLVAFQQAWLRPDKAKVFVVSDRPLAEVQALMEARLGSWRATGPAGTKAFATMTGAAPRIVLIDRPNSPQSYITGGAQTGLVGTDDLLPYTIANDALGGSFLSRINMNLREDKHWAYGASGSFQRNEVATPFTVTASVQANQTGPSLAELMKEVKGFTTTSPLTQAELDRSTGDAVRALAGSYETSSAVLRAMVQNDTFKRPDDYYAQLATKVGALRLNTVQADVAKAIDPTKFVWVVVGDAKAVKPQLDALGLPVEVVTPQALASAQ